MSELGLIQVYTGNGKGKTTASLGLAFRAVGHGFKICMLQFIKDDDNYGEVKAKNFLPGFELIQVGRQGFINFKQPADTDIKLAQEGWELAKQKIVSGKYDIVILDELNVVLAGKLLAVNDVVNFLTGDFLAIPQRPEIIITGRYAPQEIINIAHLVTEMQEIRHSSAAGVSARQGIEF